VGLHLIHASNDEQGAGVSRVRVRVGWCTRHCPLVKRKRQGGLTAEQQQGDAVVRCHAEGLGGYAFRFGDAARRRFIGDSSPIHRRLPPHVRPARAPAVLSSCIDVKARHGRHRISSQCSFRPAGVSRHRSWVCGGAGCGGGACGGGLTFPLDVCLRLGDARSHVGFNGSTCRNAERRAHVPGHRPGDACPRRWFN